MLRRSTPCGRERPETQRERGGEAAKYLSPASRVPAQCRRGREVQALVGLPIYPGGVVASQHSTDI